MKGRIGVVGLVVTIVVLSAVLFSGCIEKETPIPPSQTPTPMPSHTPTPTPMPTPTPTPMPTLTPTPTPTPTPPLKTYRELSYAKANGEQITLINYRDSTKPTFHELRKFIEDDKTNEITYREFSYVCGDYAEQVHNNAEAKGIKAGVAVVSFKNDIDLHALNVFDVKDYGRVYVDCTGDNYFFRGIGIEYFCDPDLIDCNTDGFAYIEEGKEYGVISMDVVDFNTKYGYYKNFKDHEEDFWRDINSYNKEVIRYDIEMASYNRDVDHYNSLPSVYYDDESYSAVMELYDELEEQERDLDSWSSTLDSKLRTIKNREEKYCCGWSLGIVENVEIFW